MIRYNNLNIGDIRLGDLILNKIYKGDLLVFLKNTVIEEPIYDHLIIKGAAFSPPTDYTEVKFEYEYSTDIFKGYSLKLGTSDCAHYSFYDISAYNAQKLYVVSYLNFRVDSISTLGIFKNCTKLLEVNIDTIPLGHTALFENCENLVTVNITGGSIYYGYNMFCGCSLLEILDLSNVSIDFMKNNSWSTWQNNQNMFKNCTKLKYLDISNPDNNIEDIATSSCTGMFDGCTALTTIKCSSAFKSMCFENIPHMMTNDIYNQITWDIV